MESRPPDLHRALLLSSLGSLVPARSSKNPDTPATWKGSLQSTPEGIRQELLSKRVGNIIKLFSAEISRISKLSRTGKFIMDMNTTLSLVIVTYFKQWDLPEKGWSQLNLFKGFSRFKRTFLNGIKASPSYPLVLSFSFSEWKIWSIRPHIIIIQYIYFTIHP